ncbi:MAG TPA: hypothetical protein VHQ01_00815, partial [Pyrinomonadaceae bacterium]|nr:hypothetical protein [Pyrinomonadaceae bacterium]
LRTKDDGIALEFLQYIAPTDGRSFPSDTRSSDLWHWEISFVAPGLDQFFALHKPDLISSGVVDFQDRQLGFGRAAMIRDPSGHAVRLIEK